MARVLVTDGHARSSLAAVRSLGRAGHEVFVATRRHPSLASVSRFAAGAPLIVPGPQDAAVSALLRFVETTAADLVVPTTDESMHLALSRFGHAIGRAVIAGPELDAYEALTDKAALLRRCEELGIPVPRTITARAPGQLPAAAERIGYPCVLKPHRSVVRTGDQLERFSVRHIETAAELRASVRELPASAFPVLVQERIDGPGEGVFMLLDAGRRVAAFGHRRLREYPPSGGASTYRESIALPDDALEWADRLLSSVGWSGVAMVEFKRAARDGTAYLMEVNGRFWGSLQLAIDAGVDFPALLARVFLGSRPEPVCTYRVGVRNRWLWGDVDHLLARLRRSPEELHLRTEGGSASRLAALAAFLRFVPGERLETWDWADPMPFLHESRGFLGRIGRHRLRRRPSRRADTGTTGSRAPR